MKKLLIIFILISSLIISYGQDEQNTRSKSKQEIRREQLLSSKLCEGDNIADYMNLINSSTDFLLNKKSAGLKSSGAPKTNWSYLGPKGILADADHKYKTSTGQGRIDDVWINPSNRNHMYAGTFTGGLWETTNNGDTWENITVNYPEINGIPAIGVNMEQDIIFFAHYSDLGYSNGVFIANTNNPTIWNASNTGDLVGKYPSAHYSMFPQKILQHPKDTKKSIFFLLTTARIYRGINGGDWEEIYYDPSINPWTSYKDGFRDIEISLDGGVETIYASGNGVIKSTDGGSTWTDITAEICSTGIWPETISWCEVAVENNSSPGEVWFRILSTHYGPTGPQPHRYLVKYDGAGNYSLLGHEEQAGSMRLGTTVSPNNPDIVYLPDNNMHLFDASIGEFRTISLTSPESGQPILGPGRFVHMDVRDIYVVDDEGEDKVYVCHDGGLSWGKSESRTDGYYNWYSINDDGTCGIHNTSLLGIAGLEYGDDILVTGAHDVSAFVYDEKYLFQDFWFHTKNGDGSQCLIDPDNPSNIYVLNYGGSSKKIHKSSDRGKTFNSSFSDGEMGITIRTKMRFSPEDSKVIYLGNSGHIRKFTDLSIDYSYVDIVPPGIENFQSRTIEALDVCKGVENDIIWAAKNQTFVKDKQSTYGTVVWDNESTYHSCVWKSLDGGNSWDDVTAGLGGLCGGNVTDILINPANINEVWITFSGINKSGSLPVLYKKIFRTIDGGSTWEPYVEGIPDGLPINDIILDKENLVLYIGTDVGVFRRHIYADNWENISNNMQNGAVMAMTINYTVAKLRVAVYGGGVWETELYFCPDELDRNLSATTIIGDAEYEASNEIVTTSTTQGNVYMVAGTDVKMNPPFIGNPGFVAKTDNLTCYGSYAPCVITRTKSYQIVFEDNEIELEVIETTKGADIAVYPNPASNYLVISVDTNEEFHLVIYNTSGQKVIDDIYFSEEEIDISALNSGAYVLSITTHGKTHNKKLIIN